LQAASHWPYQSNPSGGNREVSGLEEASISEGKEIKKNLKALLLSVEESI
jgi:hypothetical protein